MSPMMEMHLQFHSPPPPHCYFRVQLLHNLYTILGGKKNSVSVSFPSMSIHFLPLHILSPRAYIFARTRKRFPSNVPQTLSTLCPWIRLEMLRSNAKVKLPSHLSLSQESNYSGVLEEESVKSALNWFPQWSNGKLKDVLSCRVSGLLLLLPAQWMHV